MTKATIIFMLVGFFFISVSCSKDGDKDPNFYHLPYRTGLWISPNKKDTLEFVSSSSLVRKGYYYSREEYRYSIEDNVLFITALYSDLSTQHPILKVEGNTVVLDNMYVTTGLGENSGTFIKAP